MDPWYTSNQRGIPGGQNADVRAEVLSHHRSLLMGQTKEWAATTQAGKKQLREEAAISVTCLGKTCIPQRGLTFGSCNSREVVGVERAQEKKAACPLPAVDKWADYSPVMESMVWYAENLLLNRPPYWRDWGKWPFQGETLGSYWPDIRTLLTKQQRLSMLLQRLFA